MMTGEEEGVINVVVLIGAEVTTFQLPHRSQDPSLPSNSQYWNYMFTMKACQAVFGGSLHASCPFQRGMGAGGEDGS